ncbi:MAG: 4Fe-4S binding protein [Thermodesulfobacteriota bacterium]|nr:4Fe-4S binding protein [Thermodesulfobacteriota bacterium]
MIKAEVVLDESRCFGCGYCEKFCPRGCIEILGDKFTSVGYKLPTFTKPDECVACGICVWMCPHLALEVYQCIEN